MPRRADERGWLQAAARAPSPSAGPAAIEARVAVMVVRAPEHLRARLAAATVSSGDAALALPASTARLRGPPLHGRPAIHAARAHKRKVPLGASAGPRGGWMGVRSPSAGSLASTCFGRGRRVGPAERRLLVASRMSLRGVLQQAGFRRPAALSPKPGLVHVRSAGRVRWARRSSARSDRRSARRSRARRSASCALPIVADFGSGERSAAPAPSAASGTSFVRRFPTSRRPLRSGRVVPAAVPAAYGGQDGVSRRLVPRTASRGGIDAAWKSSRTRCARRDCLVLAVRFRAPSGGEAGGAGASEPGSGGS